VLESFGLVFRNARILSHKIKALVLKSSYEGAKNRRNGAARKKQRWERERERKSRKYLDLKIFLVLGNGHMRVKSTEGRKEGNEIKSVFA
jgi:hypothetical protein